MMTFHPGVTFNPGWSVFEILVYLDRLSACSCVQLCGIDYFNGSLGVESQGRFRFPPMIDRVNNGQEHLVRKLLGVVFCPTRESERETGLSDDGCVR